MKWLFIIIKVSSTISPWPQFSERKPQWMMYLLLGSLVTCICRIGAVFVNDLKLDLWLSLESMSSSHGNVYQILLDLQYFRRKQHAICYLLASVMMNIYNFLFFSFEFVEINFKCSYELSYSQVICVSWLLLTVVSIARVCSCLLIAVLVAFLCCN